MKREIFTSEHDAFRDMVRAFIAKEITPYHEQWERDGMVSRDVWRPRAGPGCSASTSTRSTAAAASPTTGTT